MERPLTVPPKQTKQNKIMPKPYSNNTLGFSLVFQAPTLDEAIQQLGKDVVEEVFTSQMIYRNWNPKFYDMLGERLVAETGVAIPDSGKFTTSKDANGKEVKTPIPVSTKIYLGKLIADGVLTQDRATELANEVAASDELKVLDISQSTRVSKPSKEAMELAATVLARVEHGEITADAWISKYDTMNPQRPFATFGEWNQENVARAIKENSDRAARIAKTDLA